jgi:hypothetical protein
VVPVVYGTARLLPVALIGYLLAMVWTAFFSLPRFAGMT